MISKPRTSLYQTLTVEFGMSEREIILYLSPTLASLALNIGLVPVLKLLDHYGGQQIYLPGRVDTWSGFVDALGVEHAAKIIDILGGDQKFDVSNPFGVRFMRRMQVVSALREGASINEVATRYSVSRSMIKECKKVYGLSKKDGSAVEARQNGKRT